jgi:hypothetical protein
MFGLNFHQLLTIFLFLLQVFDYASVCFAKCVFVTISFVKCYIICLLLNSFWLNLIYFFGTMVVVLVKEGS